MKDSKFVPNFVQGLSRLLVLWLLSIEPRSGYGLMGEVKKLTGHKLHPSFMYPFLRSLEGGEFIVGKWVKKGERHVKYYSLTERGKHLLERAKFAFRNPMKGLIMDLLKNENAQ
jgi:DNA-binding PadR family transcriptional regulator